MALPLTKGFLDTIHAPMAATFAVVRTLRLCSALAAVLNTQLTLGLAASFHLQPTAPPVEEPASKHAPDLAQVDEGMVGTMQELRIGVVERNQDFSEQLAGVYARRDAAMRRLTDDIIPSREAGYKALHASFAAAISALEAELTDRISATYAAHNASVVPLNAALDGLHAREQAFYKEEIPDTNARQCGKHIRMMQQEKEALELDNTTIAAREARIASRLDKHIAEDGQRGAVETQDRIRQFALLDKLTAEGMTAMEASAALAGQRTGPALEELHRGIAAETVARGAGDAGFVGAMRTAMERLRTEAIANFGYQPDEDGGKEGEDDEEEAEGKARG